MQSSERETTEPSVTDGNKNKRSAPDSSASIDAQARTGSDEPPRKKKKKKEKKKRKKSTEGKSELIGDAEGHEPVVHEGSSRDAATRAVVESSGSPNIPLEKRKKSSCGSDASASAAKTPLVAPPTTTGVAQPRRNLGSNSAIALNSSMTATLHLLTLRRNVLSLFDKFEVAPRICVLLKISSSKTHMLMQRGPSDGSMNYVVELYDTALKETISKLKQSDRLVRARDTVLNRKTSEFRAAIDKAAAEQSRLLAGKKDQKEKFMEKFGELRTTNDPYGSNTGLIDAGTAASLQTPTSSQGDNAIEWPNEPTRRELGESYVQGHEVVSRVERSEDATAPLVLGPAPSMANLVVSEESLIPVLGVSDANPTLPLGLKEAGSEPVDLLELSDFQLKKRVVKNRTSGSPRIIRKEQGKEWSTKLRIRLLRQQMRLEAPQISSKLES
ncbi:hypothetical protein F2Q69_00013027 [Brassica cretica]|uniref:Uncharacterized protein n=1 Tax=Brassica cretica TaxID=69181 RepID=A0A8S9QW01_BRACR|nr:hypothetical protein F2Q69_00013027 [Brassica cretica]